MLRSLMIIFIINVSVDDYLNIWSVRCQKIVKKKNVHHKFPLSKFTY